MPSFRQRQLKPAPPHRCAWHATKIKVPDNALTGNKAPPAARRALQKETALKLPVARRRPMWLYSSLPKKIRARL
jgi:hypothetical protein